MRIKVSIEFDYEVNPEHLNAHENARYQEYYRILELISEPTFTDVKNRIVETVGI